MAQWLLDDKGSWNAVTLSLVTCSCHLLASSQPLTWGGYDLHSMFNCFHCCRVDPKTPVSETFEEFKVYSIATADDDVCANATAAIDMCITLHVCFKQLVYCCTRSSCSLNHVFVVFCCLLSELCPNMHMHTMVTCEDCLHCWNPLIRWSYSSIDNQTITVFQQC